MDQKKDILLDILEPMLFSDLIDSFVNDGTMSPAEGILRKIKYMEDLTKDNTRMTVVMAMSYSSRWEITEAVRQIVA